LVFITSSSREDFTTFFRHTRAARLERLPGGRLRRWFRQWDRTLHIEPQRGGCRRPAGL